MLHVNDLTYRIEGRLIFDQATTGIPSGHKVGLVGRNGAGKTTLLRLIARELTPDDGSISVPRNARIGVVAQEAPGGSDTLIDWVLASHSERSALIAEAETASDPHRIAEIQVRLADIEAHAAPARAGAILAGLGFDEVAQRRPCSEYSGGWRMRVALAAQLFLEPDILLLDEPTNYLDLEGTLWLENYIRSYPATALIVSHDRDLLNTAVTGILHLDRGKLTYYTGGYDDFEETRREKQSLDLKLKKKQDDARRHMQAYIDRFRYKASKARQAQSRIKALERMQPIAEAIEDRVVPFRFPSPAKSYGNPMIRLDGAAAGYVPDTPVLSGLDLRIDQDDRIALLGANGNGKSTFAKLVCGRLEPLKGNRRATDKLVIGYFAQHQLDELQGGKTPYDYIAELMPEATEAQKRARLGSLGFGIEKADTKIQNLSGGEKARLLFALASFHGPNLLILDEPTNHLDVDSREALIQALNEFEGAVMLISHDRHLLTATVDRLWVVRGGTVAAYEGDIESYRAECLAERGARASRDRSRDPSQSLDSRSNRADQRREAAQKRSELAPLRRRIETLEARIAELTREIQAMDARLGDARFYSEDPAKAAQLAKERGRLARALEDAETGWLEASESYEAARAAAG